MSTIKNIPMFLWLKQYIIENGYNVGHGLFSIGHIAWLIVIIVISMIVSKYYKNANENKRQNVRKICAILIFLLEFIKIAIIGFLYPSYMNEYIPLHICSVAGMCIMFDALIPNKKIINSLEPYVFLSSAIIAVLTPSSTYPYFNFFNIHTFIYHGILIIYAACKISSKESKIEYSGIWNSMLLLLIMVFPIYYINKYFHSNYMMISDPSDFAVAKVIWNAITPKFGHIGYIAFLGLICLLVFHIIYVIGKVKKKNKKCR